MTSFSTKYNNILFSLDKLLRKVKNLKSMKFFFYTVIIFSFVFASCGTENTEVIPDVSNIEITNKLFRFDQRLASLDTNNLKSELTILNQQVPNFYGTYFKNVLPFETKTEADFMNNMKGYLGDYRIQKLQDTTEMIFADFEKDLMPKLDHSMKLMKYYFPDFQAPNLYTFTSEYTYQQFIFRDRERDGIGIGLDMFLGDKYPYKDIDPNNPSFSYYLTRTYNKAHLPKKVIEILVDDIVGRPSGSRLLDQMISNGKKLYILEKVLPMEHDSIIHEYTTKQTKWVQENESPMWAFFFDEEMFYESNTMKINKYINPSPNSPGMPDGAPGRTANYLGLQIVKAYMKKFPNTTLQELIDLKDAQIIMDKSKYKPRRK